MNYEYIELNTKYIFYEQPFYTSPNFNNFRLVRKFDEHLLGNFYVDVNFSFVFFDEGWRNFTNQIQF